MKNGLESKLENGVVSSAMNAQRMEDLVESKLKMDLRMGWFLLR